MFEYFPDNYTWNMAVVTLVDEVGTISEADSVLRKVREQIETDSDLSHARQVWFEAMKSLGARLQALAEDDEKRGRYLSAARKFHRAAMYYIRADRMASHLNSERVAIYKSALASYRKARKLGRDPIEFVEIPYNGKVIPGLFLQGEGDGPKPTVIHLQGFDSIKETQFPYLGGYRPRGMNALIVDQPGAGEAIRIYGLTAEVETENYVRVLIDWLEKRRDVNAERIGLAGISMGGYFAPRAAVFEPRIKACVAWGALFDVNELVRSSQSGTEGDTRSVPDPTEHALWTWGVASSAEFATVMEKVTLKGVIDKLRCPLLITHGANDRQVPVAQALQMLAEAGSPDKELKIFTADEGGDQHCQLDNRYMGADYVADWFAERLVGQCATVA